MMIGSVSFHRIHKEHLRAEMGYMLYLKFWKQDIVSEAVEAIIKYGFNTLKFHSIEANANPTNVGIEKVLQKFNFIKEAYFKENYYFNGEFLDTAIYSLRQHS